MRRGGGESLRRNKPGRCAGHSPQRAARGAGSTPGAKNPAAGPGDAAARQTIMSSACPRCIAPSVLRAALAARRAPLSDRIIPSDYCRRPPEPLSTGIPLGDGVVRSHADVGVPCARLSGGGVERDGPAGRLALGPAAACGDWPSWGRPAPRLCARQGRWCAAECTPSGPAGPAPAPARTHSRARSTSIFFVASSLASGVRPVHWPAEQSGTAGSRG
jgi:hypothetical protein